MKYDRSWVLLLLLGGAILFSCKKKVLEDDGLESNLNTFYTDTFSLQTTTERIPLDSLQTDGIGFSLLGSMNDPVFGHTTTSFYAQARLSELNFDFGSNPVVDSIVLSLAYNGFYGRFDNPMTVKVYEVSQFMDPEAEYYASSAFTTNGTELATKGDFTPDFDNGLSVYGDTLTPHLRVRLDDNLGDRILNASGTTNLADNDNFTQFFKGIQVVPDTSNMDDEGIIFFDVRTSNAVSRITLFYHNDTEDSLRFFMPVNTNGVIVNNYSHNFNGSDVSNFLNSGTTTDSVLFMQAIGGVRTKVTAPTIADLGDVSINEAKLIFTQIKDGSGGLDTVFTPPAELILGQKDMDGTIVNVPDQLLPGFGGTAENFTNNEGKSVNRYFFRLSRYYQDLLLGDESDSGVYIYPIPSNQNPARLVVGGGNHSQYPMKLELTYTKNEP